MRKNARPPMPQTPKATKQHYASAPPDRPKEPEAMQWRNLFTLADEMRRTEPWKWMEGFAPFAIRIPGTDRIYHCRFTGPGGALPGFVALRGTRGLCHHLLALGGMPPHAPERSLTRDGLILSFGTKKTMDKDDRTLMTSLKRFYRGGDVWPRFRSQVPCAPEAPLNAFEAEDFAPLLSQALVVASICRTDPRFCLGPEPAPGRMLLREGTWEEDGGLSWESRSLSFSSEELRRELFPGEDALRELGAGLSDLPLGSGTLSLFLRGPSSDAPEEGPGPSLVLRGSWEGVEEGEFSEPLGSKAPGGSPWDFPLGRLFDLFRSRRSLPGGVTFPSPLLEEALGGFFRSLAEAPRTTAPGDGA
ncbi:MAG TPA: hypothetical protein PLY89_10265 [Synergistaceae bacterium]|nr:hypothetical protein [Synergistaceae bacterium]